MCRNDHGGVLADIAANLLLALHDVEGAEATEIDVLAIGHILLDGSHHLFNDGHHSHFLDAGLLVDTSYDFCFSHFVLFL